MTQIFHSPGTLPFFWQSTGVEILFGDERDSVPHSRGVFRFQRPAKLDRWMKGSESQRTRFSQMPSSHPSPTQNLRDCQVEENAGRKLAEEALRESEVRLCMAVKAANVGLWDWDLLANTVYYSPEWKRQIGYNDEEISDRIDEWQSRVHPEDLGPALQRMAAHLENPQNRYETEVRLRHRDGSYRWIYTQADLLHDDAGNPVRMLGCHIDITERKQAAEALRESDARLRLAVEAGNVGL